MRAAKSFEHPAFGPCEPVPSVVAVRWRRPLSRSEVAERLAGYSLSLATAAPELASRPEGEARNPRHGEVNQSETLSWVSLQPRSNVRLDELESGRDVEWVAPVYRAVRAEEGPQSWFAVNPKVLLVSAAAPAAVGELRGLDSSVAVNETRSGLLKGFVVLDLPNANALELLEGRREKDGAAAAREIKLETLPYLSPVCCGTTAAAAAPSGSGGKCLPAVAELLPNDPLYPQQWGLRRINAPRAWPLSTGDPNVVVAVIDEGVELGHPDLNVWPVSYSTVTHTNNGSPVGSHGTACAGIIAARFDNGTGVAGLAGNCRVMAIATNWGDLQVAEGLYFAADNGARVVSMSFGVYPNWMIWDLTLIEAALQYCQERNVLLVAATGNEDQAVSRFPATDPRTLGVGGSNRDDVRKATGDTSGEFWGACYGPDVDVVAPCLQIPTTDRLGGAGYTVGDYTPGFNGTSAATPHVAALAGLLISVNPALTNLDVRRIISATTDKINAGPYAYLPTAGKPYGTWTKEVGYGRINAERALLAACGEGQPGKCATPCCVDLPVPDACCVSPCDPPWRPDQQCLIWYEARHLRVPVGVDIRPSLFRPQRRFIEVRVTYEHRLCLLGKQHGPLLFTQTLLPGEKVTLFHSDRYRRITSEVNRYSVQTTFMQFLSVVHQARTTNSVELLRERLNRSSSASSGSFGGGLLGGLIGLPSGSVSSETSVVDHNQLRVSAVAESFDQSVTEASKLTHAERSVVVSNYEEKESLAVTARLIQNDNACRAVTYFVRKVVELYAVSTLVRDIEYRLPGAAAADWRSSRDLDGLSAAQRAALLNQLALLPRIGDAVQRPRPVSLPTDGTVYDPELAHCCSCEPQREAAIAIQLEKQKAEALKACLEAEALRLELERRRLLLQRGQLEAFAAPAALVP